MKNLKHKFKIAAIGMVAAVGMALGQEQSKDSIKQKEPIKTNLLTRYVQDVDFSNDPTVYRAELPNIIAGAKYKGISVQGALKYDTTLNPSTPLENGDVRVLFLYTNFALNKNNTLNAQAGMFSPFNFSALFVEHLKDGKGFGFVTLDKEFSLINGGLTGAQLNKHINLSETLKADARGGIAWKIDALNKRFGAEDGPGYTTSPSFYVRGDLTWTPNKHTKIKGTYQYVDLSENKVGVGRTQNYASIYASRNIGQSILIYNAEFTSNKIGENDPSQNIVNIVQIVTPLDKGLYIRPAIGHSAVNFKNAKVIGEMSLIKDFNENVRGMIGVGHDTNFKDKSVTTVSAGLIFQPFK